MKIKNKPIKEHEFIDFENYKIDPIDPEDKTKEKKQKSKAKKTKIDRHIFRRAYSERQLFDIMPKTVENNTVIHIMSGGDIDAFTFLQWILMKQKLDYMLLSTWVMANTDAKEIIRYKEKSDLNRIDAYLGEIFKSSHLNEYNLMKEAVKPKGRVAVFDNHAKCFAGYGNKFSFVITSSANINTNPRVENTNIFIGKAVYQFYKKFFDGIIAFNKKEYPKWQADQR